LEWAKIRGFKHYTTRMRGKEIRVRQFSPNFIKKVLGQFKIGPVVKGLYVVKK